MTVDHRAHHLKTVRDALSTVVYPLQVAVNLPIQWGHWISENFASRSNLVDENERLRRELLVAGSRLEKYTELESENQRLRRLLDSAEKVGERVLVAELLAVDMDPFSRRIVLNKGRRDGVAPGQSLVDSHGVMGQIVQAGPISSSGLLITDPSHAMPVQLQRTGLRAIAVGTGSVNELELLHIPNNADVRVSDLMITSGLGGRFPSGYPVGRVVSVERDRGHPFARVVVEPSAHLERNREVLLVWTPDSDGAPPDPIARTSDERSE